MLVDTAAPVSVAVSASWRAVADHPGPIALWAVVIALLVSLGMVTALLGLVVVLRRRSRLSDDHFEPEPDAPETPEAAPPTRTAP